MSDLQRSFAKSKLANLPPEPTPTFDERDEDEVDVSVPTLGPRSDSSSSASSTGTIVPSPGKNLFERPKGSMAAKSRTAPLPWTDFFAQDLHFDHRIGDLHINHHAYLTPPSGSGPLFVTHHGAGSSGLSFATFTAEILKLLPTAGVLSLDARGHGETRVTSTSNPTSHPALDLCLETLSSDLAYVLGATIPQLPAASSTQPIPIILIGHSLGGAVITHVAYTAASLLPPTIQLLGHIVLDVVEGSAIDALQSMESYLSTRPKAFASISSGIEWHIRSRTIRNTTSARVSVPPLLISFTDPEDATLYQWRTDLAATKPFWNDWFTGLSAKFLQAKGGKLLILAGTDRLDKELMIGQMQGKYQLQVFPEAGHFVHEDQPVKTAAIVADFYHRNDRSALVLPMKVDELIRLGKLNKPGADLSDEG